MAIILRTIARTAFYHKPTAPLMSSVMSSYTPANPSSIAGGKTLEDVKTEAQLVITLADRYGGRAIQRSSSGGSEDESSSAPSTSPSSFQPFSSKWTARYWQLQKIKAQDTLAELERITQRQSESKETPASLA
jgi:hypothetical protein